MKVFVTGATGTVGKATVDALAEAGYDITGMARSDEGVASLRAKGITPVKADLGSLDIIKAEAAKADAVVNLENHLLLHRFPNKHILLYTV